MREDRFDIGRLSSGRSGRFIKICGMTCPEDIGYANKYLPDLAGFILFYPKSKRNVSLETAVRLKKELRKGIGTVAVTVAPTVREAEQIAAAGFDLIQIHGAIEDEVYESVRIPILRAFNVTDLEQYASIKDLDKIVGYVFDAKAPGSGRTFDWNLLRLVPEDGKLRILAGGIDENNVKKAIREVRPDGIDVSSAVERPDVDGKCGGKDPDKMKKIIRMVHDEK